MPERGAATHPPLQEQSASLLYLHCILEPASPGEDLLRSGRVPGMEPERPAFGIREAGLVAVVSQVPAEVFDEAPLNALLGDLSRLAPLLLRHEETVRGLLDHVPALVPMAFGRVYRTEGGVRELLEGRAGELRDLLRALEGKQEWGLKIARRRGQAAKVIERLSPKLLALSEEEAQAAPGRAYLIRRQKERLRAEEEDRLLGAALDRYVEGVRSTVCAMQVEDLPPAEPGEQSLAFKASLLVETKQVAAFLGAINDLNREYEEIGLSASCNGPWAPYSFVATAARE